MKHLAKMQCPNCLFLLFLFFSVSIESFEAALATVSTEIVVSLQEIGRGSCRIHLYTVVVSVSSVHLIVLQQ